MFKWKSPQTAPLSAATPLQSSSSTCEWLNWPTMFICWSVITITIPWLSSLSSFASWSWWPSLSRCCWSPLHIPRPGSLRTADRSPCCIPPPAGSFIKVLFWSFHWSSMKFDWYYEYMNVFLAKTMLTRRMELNCGFVVLSWVQFSEPITVIVDEVLITRSRLVKDLCWWELISSVCITNTNTNLLCDTFFVLDFSTNLPNQMV